MVQRGVVRFHNSTDEKIAYILTKALPKGKFFVFTKYLRLMDVASLDKGQH